jgi:DNA processing protein
MAHRLGALTWQDPAYPSPLRHLYDPPPVIWIRGDPAVLARPAVAVVGARAALPESLALAESLGHELAEAGLLVVSGLARGIDSAAHRGALRDGATVAVCGTGIDRVYPPEHGALAAAIAGAGALVTELTPGTPPRAPHFPRRNRIIAGLSSAVVVVEASERSGALGTARAALEAGREVMAVPGSVGAGRNRGGHALLRDGATIVESAADVVAALPDHVRVLVRERSPAPAAAPAAAGMLAGMRPGRPYGVDELLELARVPLAALCAELSRLEVAGEVERREGGRFLRPHRK